MLKLEGFYIWVDNLDEAISFYEKVFEQKIANRESSRWANFGSVKTYIIGIYNCSIDGELRKSGNNITPELRTQNIEQEHQRIEKLEPKSITEIFVIKKPVLYKYFHFEDKWGNIWEVTEHFYD